MVHKPCPVGKLYVLPGDFSYTLRTAKPAHWENSLSGQWFILRFKYRETCPLGKFYVLPSDLSCTLRTSNAARWADSTS
jgi:hypothetical protein